MDAAIGLIGVVLGSVIAWAGQLLIWNYQRNAHAHDMFVTTAANWVATYVTLLGNTRTFDYNDQSLSNLMQSQRQNQLSIDQITEYAGRVDQMNMKRLECGREAIAAAWQLRLHCPDAAVAQDIWLLTKAAAEFPSNLTDSSEENRIHRMLCRYDPNYAATTEGPYLLRRSMRLGAMANSFEPLSCRLSELSKRRNHLIVDPFAE
jgi:hypothetical protein